MLPKSGKTDQKVDPTETHGFTFHLLQYSIKSSHKLDSNQLSFFWFHFNYLGYEYLTVC